MASLNRAGPRRRRGLGLLALILGAGLAAWCGVVAGDWLRIDGAALRDSGGPRQHVTGPWV